MGRSVESVWHHNILYSCVVCVTFQFIAVSGLVPIALSMLRLNSTKGRPLWGKISCSSFV